MKKFDEFVNENIEQSVIRQITYKNRRCFIDEGSINPPTKQIPTYLDEELTIPFKQGKIHVYVPVIGGKVYSENKND